jgi:heterodisulfide reductase subunit A-like polyferredoxin
MFAIAYIDRNKCIGCKTCERYCPTGAIRVIGKKARVNPLICLGCGICSYFCKQQAIYPALRHIPIPVYRR